MNSIRDYPGRSFFGLFPGMNPAANHSSVAKTSVPGISVRRRGKAYTEASLGPAPFVLNWSMNGLPIRPFFVRAFPRTEGIHMYRRFALLSVLIMSSFAFGQGASTTRPAITGISHMTLYADDLKKSQGFYGGLLAGSRCPREGWSQVSAFMRIICNTSSCSPTQQGIGNPL